MFFPYAKAYNLSNKSISIAIVKDDKAPMTERYNEIL